MVETSTSDFVQDVARDADPLAILEATDPLTDVMDKAEELPGIQEHKGETTQNTLQKFLGPKAQLR